MKQVADGHIVFIVLIMNGKGLNKIRQNFKGSKFVLLKGQLILIVFKSTEKKPKYLTMQ